VENKCVFAEQLRWAREQSGMTQKQVAEKLGLHEGSYANYECGFRQPNLDMLVKIAKVLQTTPNALLDFG